MLSSSLSATIAQATPKDVELTFRHLVNRPTPCPALFSPPPGQSDQPTTCENHFLTVSIIPDAPEDGSGDSRDELFIFAIEILVFTTATLTTVFVSKADSTGYLYRLNLPPTAKSLMRSISTSFLLHVISSHHRPGIRLVLSLFARAQNQYLFPGSVENPHKHILDDRGLVKWWCRVVDPILRRHEPETEINDSGQMIEGENRDIESKASSATAYLIVPGCDKFESRTFFPPSAKLDPQTRPRWLNSYPLYQICGSQTAPPRCQVPRFPDDPKARFLLELDDEVPDITNESNAGKWRSIKTIDQFWEMMAYRQECSSGRLVGFLWVVINPPGLLNSAPMVSSTSLSAHSQTISDLESTVSNTTAKVETPPSLTSDRGENERRRNSNGEEHQTPEHRESGIGGPIPQCDVLPKIPPTHSNGFSSENNTGAISLNNEDYQDLMNLLVELDFDNERAAVQSTNSWVSKLSTIIGRNDHGETVIGESQPTDDSRDQFTGTSNLLSGGLVRKRKKDDAGDAGATVASKGKNEPPPNSGLNISPPITTPMVNVLDASMIRKKKRREES
ncbi:hypothetical protein AJ78_00836 [Emergomyces pasteurianus Ep9510]|uniref:histone acetyltransferase n=1 Tax=Emergomyces pasteurianus Ep9510 TaxID=1447872 RepID=A0A1J9QSP5_9EURO|nr:hypothetical protein AJ78_00836 [Emergomyces pasteurianus Ep9510]